MSKCSVEDCLKQARKTGLCGKHYERKRVHGSVDAYFPNRISGKPCPIEGCTNLTISSDVCAVHYARRWRHGSTDSLIPNYGCGKIRHKQGYTMVWVPELKKYRMEHIVVAEKALGKPLPVGAVVHHMNRKKRDNFTPLNLIICPDQTYHLLLHKRMKQYAQLGYCLPELQ